MKPVKPNNNRNFKPVKISESLKTINQKVLYKFGKIDYTIHAKWPEIVGIFFVQHSKPQRITSIQVGYNTNGETIYEKYLHVNVTPAAAVEFQHFQNKIIEKINSFFGYKAIHGIKIHQKLTKKSKFSPKKNLIKNQNIEQKKIKIKNTIKEINDKELEESLLNLGLSISNEENK